jgi:hypothetical protein
LTQNDSSLKLLAKRITATVSIIRTIDFTVLIIIQPVIADFGFTATAATTTAGVSTTG